MFAGQHYVQMLVKPALLPSNYPNLQQYPGVAWGGWAKRKEMEVCIWPGLPLLPARSVHNTPAATALGSGVAALLLSSVRTSTCLSTNTLRRSFFRYISWWHKMSCFNKATSIWLISLFFRSFFWWQKDTSLDVCHCIIAGVLQNNPDPALAPDWKTFWLIPFWGDLSAEERSPDFQGAFAFLRATPQSPPLSPSSPLPLYLCVTSLALICHFAVVDLKPTCK